MQTRAKVLEEILFASVLCYAGDVNMANVWVRPMNCCRQRQRGVGGAGGSSASAAVSGSARPPVLLPAWLSRRQPVLPPGAPPSLLPGELPSLNRLIHRAPSHCVSILLLGKAA